MSPSQKRTFLVLLAVGLAVFVLFAWPNSLGARTESMLAATSIDEPVTYPYVVRMVTPPKDLREAVNRWLIYGDYHYGYPFYFLSSLSILPVVWAKGSAFVNFTWLNLLILRQLISVLPMLLAAGLLVYAQTRFESTRKSLLLFLLLLSIRAVVRSEIQWWHPDALSVLAVVVTLFFLQRDRLHFNHNFGWAAVACGLAAGIKLAGFFFAPAVFGYLLAGWLTRRLSLAKAALKAGLFIGLMALSLFLSNPFLVNSGARQEMLNIQLYKTQELDQGYTHDDPYYYQKGPQFWEWTLSNWYAHPLLLAVLLLSLLAGCIWGPNRLLNRLILAWIIPHAIYLLWFVSVKPDHYWLPVMLPLYSAALNLMDAFPQSLRGFSLVALRLPIRLRTALQALVTHPLVGDLDTAEKLLDEMLKAHGLDFH